MATLTLEVSDDVDALLHDLARAEKVDKYEVIRRALGLYQYVHREAEQKRKLSITAPSFQELAGTRLATLVLAVICGL